MDKLEYIPGDLVSVYVGVKKYIVEVIGTENENEALLYQIKFPNGEIQYADKDNIVPIPLTPEILEKNGWEKPDGFDSYWLDKIGLLQDGDVWHSALGSTKIAITLSNIQYVHELQHLFFGLGLNSEMEV